MVIAGDGAFFMHGMEMHTAVQYRLPVTFVLFNNNAHAMCVTREQLFYDDLYSYNRFAPSQLGRRAGARCSPGCRRSTSATSTRLAAALRARAGRRRSVGGQRRMLGRRNPAVRTISRQCCTNTLSNNRFTPKENHVHVAASA